MPQANRDWMNLALDLAELGRGAVEPNPMVGCVLVSPSGQELGRGWHRRFGGPHAEIEALRDAAGQGHGVAGATAYVTLEPCCHYGKTPPCSQALIEARVARVVAAMEDPDPHVAGGGMRQLAQAGIEVELGVCAARARRLLAPYVKTRRQGRPWVIAKWAQSRQGLWALGSAGRWISCEPARRQVHQIRSWCDGVCIGAGTVLADDPLLTNRTGQGKQPARVVIDRELSLPTDSALVSSLDVAPLIVVVPAHRAADPQARRLADLGAEILPLDGVGVGDLALGGLLDELGCRRWTYLLVEGGPTLMACLARERLLDEAWVYVCPVDEPTAAQAVGLPRLNVADLARELDWPEPAREMVGPDTLQRYWLAGR